MNHRTARTAVPAPRPGRLDPGRADPGRLDTGRIDPSAVDPNPPDPGRVELCHAGSPRGELVVATTPEGLPVSLHIAPGQLAVGPDVLAGRIVALCALARGIGAHRRREELARAGTSAEVLDAFGLPDRATLLALEETADRWCRRGTPS